VDTGARRPDLYGDSQYSITAIESTYRRLASGTAITIGDIGGIVRSSAWPAGGQADVYFTAKSLDAGESSVQNKRSGAG
jgi:hypothetical protein